jgi:TolA-binding protein
VDKALAQYQQTLDVDPRSADARYGQAMALAALGRVREARDSLAESAKRYPDQPRFAEMLERLSGK